MVACLVVTERLANVVKTLNAQTFLRVDPDLLKCPTVLNAFRKTGFTAHSNVDECSVGMTEPLDYQLVGAIHGVA